MSLILTEEDALVLKEMTCTDPFRVAALNIYRDISQGNDKMTEVEKMRQGPLQQLETIEALSAAILREVFDFQEPNL